MILDCFKDGNGMISLSKPLNPMMFQTQTFETVRESMGKFMSRNGEKVAGKSSGMVNKDKIGHQCMKSMSKSINVTLKYGCSNDFPFNNSTSIVHPSTVEHVTPPSCKLSIKFLNVNDFSSQPIKEKFIGTNQKNQAWDEL